MKWNISKVNMLIIISLTSNKGKTLLLRKIPQGKYSTLETTINTHNLRLNLVRTEE